MNTTILRRSVKPATGPVIKRILVRCPSTGKLSPTGKTVEEALWEDSKWTKPRMVCPHCRQSHNWSKKDVVLAR